MLLKETLRKLVEIQASEVNALDQGTKRDLLDTINMQSPLRREMKGLKEAMEAVDIKKGMIITLDQEDKFGDINVVPAWKWMSGQ